MYGLKMFKTWVEMSAQARVETSWYYRLKCLRVEVSSFENKGLKCLWVETSVRLVQHYLQSVTILFSTPHFSTYSLNIKGLKRVLTSW